MEKRYAKNKLSSKYGKNEVFQLVNEGIERFYSTKEVIDSWRNSLYLLQHSNQTGLRTPQIGALYSIKAHWTVSTEAATIVMPTGTGKTETMISTVLSEELDHVLIIVPSELLRKQTAQKFSELGVLPRIGVVSQDALYPTVAVLRSKPSNDAELFELIEQSNVIISTVALLQRFPASMFSILSEMCSVLIVDEAHHIAAKTWEMVKGHLQGLKCIQFTATPFRNDGRKLDGKIIYNFPLALAQEQGYFQVINYSPIWEFDEAKGDLAIADASVKQLKYDLSHGYDHAILVRAKDKRTADRLFTDIYSPFFSEFCPVLIHSGVSSLEKEKRMEMLKSGESKIVVCVDMFGEGIDIPKLKIAAIHDKYKSLPITLQFVGRFARTSTGLGAATLITNIANDELSESLRDLYAQDSDWNKLLSVKSSEQIGEEIQHQEFVRSFYVPLINGVSIQQLRPKVSMTAYLANGEKWNIPAVCSLIKKGNYSYTVNKEDNVLIIVERMDTNAQWTSFRGISDTTWHLHLAYFDRKRNILYVNSTIKGFSDQLARALFESCMRITGEKVFRCLYGINRLMLGTVGLISAADGPIRFKMFAGFDIETGISEAQKHNTFKSNLFGVGFNGQGKVSVGCSHRGRIWSRWVESVNYWMEWCDRMGEKVLDESIDTRRIFDGALIPEVVNDRPHSMPFCIEWPQDFDAISEERIEFEKMNKQYPYHSFDIHLVNPDDTGVIQFKVGNEEIEECFHIEFGKESFSVISDQNTGLMIRIGKNRYSLASYFSEHPPLVKFVDQSMLEGNILVKCTKIPPKFNSKKIVVLDWTGVNIQKESQTITREKDSVQYRIIHDMLNTREYSVIFDDDGSGEVADIVAIKENETNIRFEFVHCKFSQKPTPGARIDDLYAVCGQAEKSVKWCGAKAGIIDRLIKREVDRQRKADTRLEIGSIRKLREIKNKLRVFPASVGITIVQPGVSASMISEDMLQILGSTASYLEETYGIELKVVCST